MRAEGDERQDAAAAAKVERIDGTDAEDERAEEPRDGERGGEAGGDAEGDEQKPARRGPAA